MLAGSKSRWLGRLWICQRLYVGISLHTASGTCYLQRIFQWRRLADLITYCRRSFLTRHWQSFNSFHQRPYCSVEEWFSFSWVQAIMIDQRVSLQYLPCFPLDFHLHLLTCFLHWLNYCYFVLRDQAERLGSFLFLTSFTSALLTLLAAPVWLLKFLMLQLSLVPYH